MRTPLISAHDAAKAVAERFPTATPAVGGALSGWALVESLIQRATTIGSFIALVLGITATCYSIYVTRLRHRLLATKLPRDEDDTDEDSPRS